MAKTSKKAKNQKKSPLNSSSNNNKTIRTPIEMNPGKEITEHQIGISDHVIGDDLMIVDLPDGIDGHHLQGIETDHQDEDHKLAHDPRKEITEVGMVEGMIIETGTEEGGAGIEEAEIEVETEIEEVRNQNPLVHLVINGLPNKVLKLLKIAVIKRRRKEEQQNQRNLWRKWSILLVL